MANPQKIKASVKNVFLYGKQVYKIAFTIEKRFPRFKAGQFLHLTLDDFDPTTGFWPESRVFSISACSDDRKEVTIVYSVKGSYTKRMEESLSLGMSVWLKAPYGEFIISKHIRDGQTAVLIAGGTGVSPFIPFLKQSGTNTRIQLNYGLRSKDLIIFEDDFTALLDQENFSMNLYLEEMSWDIQVSKKFAVMEGLLSVDSILKGVRDKVESIFFISGPPAMIELFQQQLIKSGIAQEKIKIDEWG